MTTRTIPPHAQWLIINTHKGKKLLTVNDMIVMTSDYIFRKDIHPQQINPWVAREEILGLDTITIHPAALVKMLVKAIKNTSILCYVDLSAISKTKYTCLIVDEDDLKEAVYKVKNCNNTK